MLPSVTTVNLMATVDVVVLAATVDLVLGAKNRNAADTIVETDTATWSKTEAFFGEDYMVDNSDYVRDVVTGS